MDHKPLSNFEAWKFYMKDCISPESYIDMGFYYMISAALQRRVYLGSDNKPLFPNQFIIFVGPPGIGKGLVLTEVADILKHHKKRKNLKLPTPAPNGEGKIDEAAHEALMNEFRQQNPTVPVNVPGAPPKRPREPLAIPMAADASTYEGLVRAHALSLTSFFTNYPSRLVKGGIYTHSSLCFCLEEISSLFRKHSEDVARYLQRAFDCTDYEYAAKTAGLEDFVLSPCLNILGGTQQSFIQEVFKNQVLTEGFASRTIFIPESSPRAHTYDMFTFSPEQLAAKQQIVDHIGKLISLFGLVKQSPEAYEYIKYYVEKILPNKTLRPNRSPKLDDYYSRKRVHIEKMALAIHFSESTEFVVQVESYQKAIEKLDFIEKTMDTALMIGGRNPLGTLSEKVVEFLQKTGPSTFIVIWKAMINDLNEKQLVEVLDFLMRSGKVGADQKERDKNSNVITKYQAI